VCGEYNKAVIILKLVDIVNTLLVHALLDYAPEQVTHLG